MTSDLNSDSPKASDIHMINDPQRVLTCRKLLPIIISDLLVISDLSTISDLLITSDLRPLHTYDPPTYFTSDLLQYDL